MSSSGLGGSAAVGLGRLALFAIETPSADSNAGAAPGRAGRQHLGTFGGHGTASRPKTAPTPSSPDVAGDGQHHAWLEALLRGSGLAVPTITTGGSNPNPRPWATGIGGSGSPAASYAASRSLAGCPGSTCRSEPVPQGHSSGRKAQGLRPLHVIHWPRATHLTDIAVGEHAGGEGHQVALTMRPSLPAVARGVPARSPRRRPAWPACSHRPRPRLHESRR